MGNYFPTNDFVWTTMPFVSIWQKRYSQHVSIMCCEWSRCNGPNAGAMALGPSGPYGSSLLGPSLILPVILIAVIFPMSSIQTNIFNISISTGFTPYTQEVFWISRRVFSQQKKCFSFYNIWHSWKMGSSPVVADFQFFRQYLSCFCWSDQFWNLKLQYVAPYSKTSQCCIKKSTNHRTSNVESRSELQEGQQR